MQNRIYYAFVGLSILGIGVAIYEAYDYLTQNFNGCNFNSYVSCGTVATSGYTSLDGVPFYVMGLVWFPLVLVLVLALSRLGKQPVDGIILLPFLMIGNIFTIYLWYLELGVIHAICPVCVSLYVINYALTGLAAWQLLS